MKKNVLKSAFAITCVVAASVSSFKAYDQHDKNVAAANMLLAENVEALSQGDDPKSICTAHCNYDVNNDCLFQLGNQYWNCKRMVRK